MNKQQKDIEEYKEEIRSNNYPTYLVRNTRDKKLIGTMFLREKMDYGFHIYFIHEAKVNDLAGVHGIVTEMYYDLRNKVYWIKRNKKEVSFSVRNVDSIFPYESNQQYEVFSYLSTKSNKGMYQAAMKFLGAMGNEVNEMFGRFFYRLMTEHNYFELLHKAGIEVNRHTVIVNTNGKSPMEILGLSKTQWKIISKYKIPVRLFENLKNEIADNEMINHLAYVKKLEDEFGLIKCDSFFNNEYQRLYNSQKYHHHNSSLNIAKHYSLPIKNLIRYIYFECDVSQGLDASTAISQYADYIRMTSEMGYERFDRYPKFLRTAHDIASRNYKIKLNEIELKQWEQAYFKNQEFSYSFQNYKLFPPKDPADLVKEGNVLGHCVGSYVHKVRQGISTILFLREKEDIEKPLVTIEVVGDRIAQARGKMNYPPTEEQKYIVKKFAEKFSLAY